MGRPTPRAVLGAVLVAVVLAVALGAAPVGADPGKSRGRPPKLVCGELPDRDVKLNKDLVCPTGFHFGPTDARVTIDLGGHTLVVPGDAGRCTAPGPCGAIAGAAVVRNGTVIGTLADIGEVQEVVVAGDIEVRVGFAGVPGPAQVLGSLVIDGSVRIWGSDVTIAGNVIRGGIELVSSNSAIRNLEVTRNWILQSPRAGITVNPQPGDFPDDINGSIHHNVVWGSTGSGIVLRGGIWNIGALTVERNLLLGNGEHGFASGTTFPGPPTVRGGPVTLVDNVALANGGHGIDAEWMDGLPGTGIVDGGGNRALGNATPPECIGVVCS